MMHAYDKLYLEKARTSLGRMLDFAVYDLKYNASDFFELFIASGVADPLSREISRFWRASRELSWPIWFLMRLMSNMND